LARMPQRATVTSTRPDPEGPNPQVGSERTGGEEACACGTGKESATGAVGAGEGSEGGRRSDLRTPVAGRAPHTGSARTAASTMAQASGRFTRTPPRPRECTPPPGTVKQLFQLDDDFPVSFTLDVHGTLDAAPVGIGGEAMAVLVSSIRCLLLG